MTQLEEPPASDAELNVQRKTEKKPAPLALDASTAIATPPKSASGVKRVYDDANDHDPNDEVVPNGELKAHDGVLNGSKRLKTPDKSLTQNVETVDSTISPGNHEPKVDRASIRLSLPDILYRTQAKDQESEKSNYYYSDQRYEEWSDPLKDDDKTSASLIEIIRDVVGSWQDDAKAKPKSMDKDQWRDKDRHVKFGEDFTIKKQRRPLMWIHDPVCRSMMRFLIEYDPGQFLAGDYLSIHWPWHTLMHYHEEIENLRERIKNGKATDFQVSEGDGIIEDEEKIRRIDLLLDQIKDVYTMEVRPELQNHSASRLADFKKLWLLFRPGEEVYTRVNGELAAFIVLSSSSHSPEDSADQLIVQVWNLRVVADRLVRHMARVVIDEYEGSRLIDTLPVFPCKYAGSKEEAESQRERLIERGKKYFSIIKQRHAYMDHRGLTQDSEPRIYNGRVIIDPMSYVKYASKIGGSRIGESPQDWDWFKLRSRKEVSTVQFEPLKPNEIVQPEDNGGGQLWKKYNGLDPTDPTTQKPGFLEDRHFLLLPQNIRGFSLMDKQWETYDVGSLSEIVWCRQDMKNPFPGLILDEEKQKIVQANCRTAESRRVSPDLAADQIGGKGEGTVFLLHGPPGVGKTHTVECIANYTRQPLLSLSGCDIGTNASSETKVQHWFDLSKAWDTLILIDEADIFLTWRQPDKLHENILVTTFLRTIESFPGTIFLTTNRIGLLDLAINSRVDIAIHFASFDFESQKKLWLQYFETINKTGRGGKGVYIKEAATKAFLDDEIVKTSGLSGREIRNAFKQSIKIARHDGLINDRQLPESFKLKVKHLIQAIANCKDKTQHIVKANRVRDESELADIRSERQLVTPKRTDTNDRQIEP